MLRLDQHRRLAVRQISGQRLEARQRKSVHRSFEIQRHSHKFFRVCTGRLQGQRLLIKLLKLRSLRRASIQVERSAVVILKRLGSLGLGIATSLGGVRVLSPIFFGVTGVSLAELVHE